MKMAWRNEVLQLMPLAAMLLATAWVWPTAPERVPSHWNLHGEINGDAPKAVGLLAIPGIALAVYALLLVVPRIDPIGQNYEKFAAAYCVLRFALMSFWALLQSVILLAALGYVLNMTTWIGLLLGGLFIAIGAVMGSLRMNWFVGVRTPWTLSSELSWTKTHRLAGRLFMGMGGMSIAWALLQNWVAFVAMVVFDVGCVVAMVVYSYLVFRHDPARISSR